MELQFLEFGERVKNEMKTTQVMIGRKGKAPAAPREGGGRQDLKKVEHGNVGRA